MSKDDYFVKNEIGYKDTSGKYDIEINDTKIPFSNTVATLVEIEIAGKITNYISFYIISDIKIFNFWQIIPFRM